MILLSAHAPAAMARDDRVIRPDGGGPCEVGIIPTYDHFYRGGQKR